MTWDFGRVEVITASRPLQDTQPDFFLGRTVFFVVFVALYLSLIIDRFMHAQAENAA